MGSHSVVKVIEYCVPGTPVPGPPGSHSVVKVIEYCVPGTRDAFNAHVWICGGPGWATTQVYPAHGI